MPSDEECNVERTCVACGYNLFGLGKEPRCPECGLLNIPSAYRQQVWELIDSGRWFFSGFFNPLKKRTPGWWWALDRAGDLKRARRAACRNILLVMVVVLVSCTTADALLIHATETFLFYSSDDFSGKPHTERELQRTIPLDWPLQDNRRLVFVRNTLRSGGQFEIIRKTKLSLERSWQGAKIAAFVMLWLSISWIGPALVGIWTQIRRGLPEFARPPHTIRAAAFYETHRLVYVSLLLAFCLLVDIVLRKLALPLTHETLYTTTRAGMIALVATFTATCWIGPLRSDYTRQLVRSRLHAVRIIIMYSILLPWVTTLALALIAVLQDGQDAWWLRWVR